MRSYLIEEINPSDMDRIIDRLNFICLEKPLQDLFWLTVPEEVLTPEQKEHLESCGPFHLALESGKDFLKLELLVRCRSKIRCSCITYATRQQREHMIQYLDDMLKNLDISI
ncbi:MAG: hypothetical protein ACOCV7_05745 [Desulfonatronovibrionaceae bacterium]